MDSLYLSRLMDMATIYQNLSRRSAEQALQALHSGNQLYVAIYWQWNAKRDASAAREYLFKLLENRHV